MRAVANNMQTPEAIFKNYRGRRAGLIKALTIDVDKFFSQCDPAKENLCLYGLPNETWEVSLPAEEVPPELPEPVLGINFIRDGLEEEEWLTYVALHSDAWLLTIAFYFGARFCFNREERLRLFNMINNLPTIYEVVEENVKKQSNDQGKNNKSGSKVIEQSNDRGSIWKNNKSVSKVIEQSNDQGSIWKNNKSGSKPSCQSESSNAPKEDEEDEEEDQLENCGACRSNYTNDVMFWIFCDVCEKWFHGKCVRITPAMADHIEKYMCPSCSKKKG